MLQGLVPYWCSSQINQMIISLNIALSVSISSPLSNPLAFATAEVDDLHNTGKMEARVAALTLSHVVRIEREYCIATVAMLAHETLTPTELTGPDVVDAVIMSLLQGMQQLTVARLKCPNMEKNHLIWIVNNGRSQPWCKSRLEKYFFLQIEFITELTINKNDKLDQLRSLYTKQCNHEKNASKY